MGTFSVSLDETYQRKAELMRTKRYPKLTTELAVKKLVRDTLDEIVPNSELINI